MNEPRTYAINLLLFSWVDREEYLPSLKPFLGCDSVRYLSHKHIKVKHFSKIVGISGENQRQLEIVDGRVCQSHKNGAVTGCFVVADMAIFRFPVIFMTFYDPSAFR